MASDGLEFVPGSVRETIITYNEDEGWQGVAEALARHNDNYPGNEFFARSVARAPESSPHVTFTDLVEVVTLLTAAYDFDDAMTAAGCSVLTDAGERLLLDAKYQKFHDALHALPRPAWQ